MSEHPMYGNRPPEAALYDLELTGFATALTVALKRKMDDMHLIRSCINCNFFKEHQGEICTAYGNQRPPARIIARGCEGHSKEVPF